MIDCHYYLCLIMKYPPYFWPFFRYLFSFSIISSELIAINILTSDIGYAYSSPGVESPPLTVKEIILLAEDEAKKWFNEIKEKADESGVQFRSETIMAKRSAASTMLDYAEEQNINLIVVGTRGRSGIKKMLLGSTASELVTYAACPVLVVK